MNISTLNFKVLIFIKLKGGYHNVAIGEMIRCNGPVTAQDNVLKGQNIPPVATLLG